MFLGQQEVHGRGLRVGHSEVRFLQRDCCQVRALLYHPMVGTPNSDWQSTQPLQDPVSRVLLD